MTRPAEPFTVCGYCELAATTTRRALRHVGGTRRSKVVLIHACLMHEDEAAAEATRLHLALKSVASRS
jgi:hypothetical protein